MTKTICGFAAVNNGKHCWIGDHCAVCNKPYPKVKTVQVGHRLIITNGIDPLRYVDLTTNEVHVYPGRHFKIDVKIAKKY